MVDDSALILTKGVQGLLWAHGWAEGLWFGGDPLWERGDTRTTNAIHTSGAWHRGEVGDSWSIPSPMCSIVSWMTSHSTGQRGAGRENGACGSPGDLQGCFKGASLPWWGVCTTPRAARAPGRAGDFQCGWGRGIPQKQGRDRERPSRHTCCAGRTLCSGGREGLQGLTHGLALAQDLVASQGWCCPWWMPWDAARRVPPGTWQSPPCLSSHLGENSAAARGQEGTQPRDRGHSGQGSPRK